MYCGFFLHHLGGSPRSPSGGLLRPAPSVLRCLLLLLMSYKSPPRRRAYTDPEETLRSEQHDSVVTALNAVTYWTHGDEAVHRRMKKNHQDPPPPPSIIIIIIIWLPEEDPPLFVAKVKIQYMCFGRHLVVRTYITLYMDASQSQLNTQIQRWSITILLLTSHSWPVHPPMSPRQTRCYIQCQRWLFYKEIYWQCYYLFFYKCPFFSMFQFTQGEIDCEKTPK